MIALCLQFPLTLMAISAMLPELYFLLVLYLIVEKKKRIAEHWLLIHLNPARENINVQDLFEFNLLPILYSRDRGSLD